MSLNDEIFGNQTAAPGGTLETRLRRIERSGVYMRAGQRISTNDYSVVDGGAVDGSADIDTSVSSVIKTGSIPPTGSTAGFAATSDATGGAGNTNLHIYWDGTNSSNRIIIERADGTRFVVPSGDKTITGLNPSTTYYFLPFWSIYDTCNVGWVIGTTGTPQIAFTVNTDVVAGAKQNRQYCEALSAGYMSLVTAAGGGSSAGTDAGGGGSPGRCVMHGTAIEPLGDHELRIDAESNTDWWRVNLLNGMSLACTHNHRIATSGRGFVRADQLVISEQVITDRGESPVVESYPFKRLCLKDSPHLSDGHLYYANGILSHNIKMYFD